MLCGPGISLESDEPTKLEIVYFYSSRCRECAHLKSVFFPGLKAKYAGTMSWKEINIDDGAENLELAVNLVLGDRKFGTLTPSVVAGKTVLMGAGQIQAGLEDAIESNISSTPAVVDEYPAGPTVNFTDMISLPVVLAAGLVDGVNPCAFAAIALLISMMHVWSYGKKKTLAVSCAYCAAVFITYFLIGIGVFGFLYSIKSFYRLAVIFRSAVGVLCFLLAALSIYDFFLYRRTGRSEALILTLPPDIKKRISLTIGEKLRGGNKDTKSLVIVSMGAFCAGVLVSCMEMICTGQVYLPALVYIMKNTQQKFMAFSYIFLYNLMFVAPLVLVTALYLLGVNSRAFGVFLKKHAGALKLAMAGIFLLFGSLIILSN
jgi:hypothetical protein